MFRYIVVTWCAENDEQERAARFVASRLKAAQWVEPSSAPGIRTFEMRGQSGLATQALPGAAGVVIGKTFERLSDPFDDMPAAQWTATEFEAEAILASRGRWLVERCWGNYVAVLRSSRSGRFWAIKDPAGSLPCFVTRFRGATLIFSFVDDLVRLGLRSFAVDREALRARLQGADFERSLLQDIDQIGRGECAEIDPATGDLSVRDLLWRPQSFSRAERALGDTDAAARALNASVRMSTQTLAAQDASIVQRLSGGWGSAIIASCLSDAPNRPRICGYTCFDSEAPADERQAARALAARLNLEHLQIGVPPRDIQLRRALHMPFQVEPVSVPNYTLRSTIEQAIASERDASLVFDDSGASACFGAGAEQYAATEYVRLHGLRPEVLCIASRVALHTHQSTWSVLRRALTTALTGSVMDAPPVRSRPASWLVDRAGMDAFSTSGSGAHPWFAAVAPAASSLMQRLGALLTLPTFYDASPRVDTPEVIAPFYSQPVVETLLRIPLHQLFEAGRGSGLARRGFAKEVPGSLASRPSKTLAPHLNARLVSLNRALLREVLLEGSLMRERLLDRAALENTLADDAPNDDDSADDIMRLFDFEMWLHAWTSIHRDVAQSGSAPVLEAGGREFESRRPDHPKKDLRCA